MDGTKYGKLKHLKIELTGQYLATKASLMMYSDLKSALLVLIHTTLYCAKLLHYPIDTIFPLTALKLGYSSFCMKAEF